MRHQVWSAMGLILMWALVLTYWVACFVATVVVCLVIKQVCDDVFTDKRTRKQ
jgi:hypothetical protein